MHIVAVDYDGTLVENKWPAHGDWMPGAVDAMKKLLEFCQPMVYTVRIAPVDLDGNVRPKAMVQQEINTIRNRLDDAGLKGVGIWTAPYKPPAVCFIDDRGMKYNGRPGAWKSCTEKVAIICNEAHKVFPEYKTEV